MSAGSAVHHSSLGYGQVQRVTGATATVRFLKGTYVVPTNTLGRVHAS